MATLFAEVSGVRVIEGRIVIPEVGAWHADVTLDREAPIAARGLTLTLGDLSMRCAPWRAPVPFQGRMRLRLIGGANGWSRMLPAKPYRSVAGVRASLILGEAARAVGELVELGDDRVIGEHYARELAPACRHLNRLYPNAWRVDADGVTRTGERASSAIVAPFTMLGFDGARGVATVATEHPAAFVPGRTFKSSAIDTTLRASGVTHSITRSGIRTEVLTS